MLVLSVEGEGGWGVECARKVEEIKAVGMRCCELGVLSGWVGGGLRAEGVDRKGEREAE